MCKNDDLNTFPYLRHGNDPGGHAVLLHVWEWGLGLRPHGVQVQRLVLVRDPAVRGVRLQAVQVAFRTCAALVHAVVPSERVLVSHYSSGIEIMFLSFSGFILGSRIFFAWFSDKKKHNLGTRNNNITHSN